MPAIGLVIAFITTGAVLGLVLSIASSLIDAGTGW